MRKLIFPSIILFLVLAGTASFFTACQSKDYTENSVFRAIPLKTPFIIEIPEVEVLLKRMAEENPLVTELKQVKELQHFFADVNEIRDQIHANGQLEKALQHKPALIAFNTEGKNSTGCLFLVSLKDRQEKSAIFDFFNTLPKVKQKSLHKRLYGQEEIYQLETNGGSFHFAFIDGIFLLSRHALFVEEAIRQIAVENLADHQQFKALCRTVSLNSDFNLYINHNTFPGFITRLVPLEFRKHLQHFGSFSDWTELDANIKQSGLLLNGFSFSEGSSSNYLNVFRGQKAVRSGMTDALSANTSLFINLSIEDLDRFYTDYDEYLKKQSLYYARETKLKTIERYSKIPFMKLFKEIAKEEFAVAFGTVTQNNPATNRFFIAKVKSQSNAREKLLPMLENYAKAQKTSLQQMQESYQLQNNRSFTIYPFPFSNLPELLFGQAFSGVESKFLCFYDNYLLFADNQAAFKRYIHDLELSETLGNDLQFQKFNQQMDSRSSFYFYLNFSKAFYLSTHYLSEKMAELLEENEQSTRKFHALGWQFSENSGNFLNTLYLKFDPVLKEEPQTIWQSKLDSTVAIKPQLVTNHLDQANKEVLIQDHKHKLYLINKEGISLWKEQLPGKIMGEIYQIDYYHNGKLQYLFNTKDKLFLFDRNGNHVARFPVDFRSPATNSVSVFDYNNNRDYRYFIACEDKQVYAYDREGKLVNGWDFKGTDGQVTSPVKHFRVGQKDYLVLADQYKTYILDRRGNTRVKSSDNFEHSKNDLYLVNAGQAAIATTDMSGTVHLHYFDGQHKQIKTGNFSKDHFFEAEDLNGDGKTDFVFADNNVLYTFTDQGKKLFERKFDFNISGKPNCYTFANNDRKIGVVCRDENRVYLVNADGSLYDGFPLHGNTDFTIGYFNHSNPYFNLVVGSPENSFYNYQID